MKPFDHVADEATRTARETLATLRETVRGIATSHDLVCGTEARIRRLGERSGAIAPAAQLIDGLVERAGLLAHNTSVQAEAVGEAGRAYAVMADEIRRLAEEARDKARQIADLVDAVRTETADALAALERAILQVVETAQIADQACERMHATEQQTERLARRWRSLAGGSTDATADTGENA